MAVILNGVLVKIKEFHFNLFFTSNSILIFRSRIRFDLSNDLICLLTAAIQLHCLITTLFPSKTFHKASTACFLPTLTVLIKKINIIFCMWMELDCICSSILRPVGVCLWKMKFAIKYGIYWTQLGSQLSESNLKVFMWRGSIKMSFVS